MKSMFYSATLKLTVWYLLILMSVGLIFSLIIYQVATSEVDARLETIERRLFGDAAVDLGVTDDEFATFRNLQAEQAQASLFSSLLYINLLFLLAGGIASYFMARNTLSPIEQAHDAQSRFTSDASHELRTPLAAMKTELEVSLRDPNLTKNEMRELLSSNLEEVDKLSKITQSLLLLSRLEHSALSTRRVAFDDIVRRIVENSNKKTPKVNYAPPEKPLYITAHPVSIEELVTILVDNALKYSPAKSKIDVVLKRKGKNARIEVTNTGKGIQPEDLPHIFDRFFRADDSRTGGQENGFGLGLSLAKKIVEVHQGDLSVSSEPNKKTTFTVSLPLYVTPSSHNKKQQKPQQSDQQF